MKRFIYFIILFFIFGIQNYLFAQEDLSASNFTEPSSQELILQELRQIHKIQAEADSLRKEALQQQNIKRDEKNLLTNPSDFSVMAEIENNTRGDFVYDEWNLYGIFTFVIALIAGLIAWITYKSQKRTEEHTNNAPISVQISVLNDLPRHFYRNLVCTCAVIFKFGGVKNPNQKQYPSESHFKKLQVLPDDFMLPIDTDNSDNSYRLMHENKLLFRNYNSETEVALEHIKRRNAGQEALTQDFDNLLFKPMFLIKETFEYEKSLVVNKNEQKKISDYKNVMSVKDENLVVRTIVIIIRTHFNKLGNNFKNLLNKDYYKVPKIISQNDFKNFEDIIDNKNGVIRSLEQLLEGGPKDLDYKSKRYGITIEKKKDEKIPLYLIHKETLINNFKGGDSANLIERIVNIRNLKEFKEFLEKLQLRDKEKEPKITDEEFYNSLKHYFDYLSKSVWDFRVLFMHILAVDTAIELNNIGMVNYPA